MTAPTDKPALTLDDVRRTAQLARLALDDAALEDHRANLAAILNHMSVLRALNLDGVEPLAHPAAAVNRWDEDSPRPPMPPRALMDIAPDPRPPFIRVPKVIGDAASS